MNQSQTDVNPDYISTNLQRAFRIVELLVGHEFDGMSMSDIAKGCNTTLSTATRAMANLQHCKWVEPLPSNEKRFRVSPHFASFSNAVNASLSQAQQRLAQDFHNYNVTAK